MDASSSERHTVGRSADSNHIVDHESVSSLHCSLVRRSDGWWILDHRSTNGTFVNGERVAEAPLADGDRVHVGLAEFVFKDGQLHSASDNAPSASGVPASSGNPVHGTRSRRPWYIGAAAVIGLGAIGAFVLFSLGSDRSKVSSDVPPLGSEVSNDVPPPLDAADLYTPPEDMGSIVQIARNSVVSVRCGFDEGSGWPIEVDGIVYIATNEHVVSACVGGTKEPVSVVLASTTTNGTVVGASAQDDLALIRADTGLDPLPTAALPPIGAWLMVVGNPIGMDRSVTFGTVTNLSEGYLITDASINPGNSGGPVFNSQGEVVAVASAKIVEEGIDRVGIAIPLADFCREVVECSQGQWK